MLGSQTLTFQQVEAIANDMHSIGSDMVDIHPDALYFNGDVLVKHRKRNGDLLDMVEINVHGERKVHRPIYST